MWLDANVLFPFYNYGVMPFWVLLIALPRAQITNMLVHSGLMPCVLGVSYTVLLAVAVAGAPEGGGLDFGSIASIRAGFESDLALLGGWVHYLAFDLFVGAWCVRDAARNGVHHLAIILPLLLILMAGPAGLLLYVILRWFWKQRFILNEG